MSDVVFDTYEATQTLRASGYEEKQAAATVSMVRDALLENVASKSDLRELETRLKADMSKIETRLKADMSKIETRLEADMREQIHGLRTEMREQIHGLRTEMLQCINAQTMRFYAIAFGIVVTCTSLTFGLLKLFP